MQDVRKAVYLVLHLVIALIQVFVLQTPLILDVNMDVKLSGLSLSQLEHINQTLLVQTLDSTGTALL